MKIYLNITSEQSRFPEAIFQEMKDILLLLLSNLKNFLKRTETKTKKPCLLSRQSTEENPWRNEEDPV